MNEKLVNEFFMGEGINSYNLFGAHMVDKGVEFVIYAPNARSVRLAGDFNCWSNNTHFLKKDHRGIFYTYIEGLTQYSRYKYIIEQCDGKLVEKADPYGFYNEVRPAWSNKVVSLDFDWTDQNWMKCRSRNFDRPVNIYEVHLGGFKRDKDGKWLNYYQMIDQLIPYVVEMGYTHIEIMPINEHGLDMSWGYQQYGYHSITSRYGSVDQLMMFINACHNNNIGVIMDVVLAHFVKDSYGLINFDGTNLYELAMDSSWGTRYFDFRKNEVKSFLLSSCNLWLDKYHIDGLRVDAVSNMIYYDGNRDRGQNNPAIEFIKSMNYQLHQAHPDIMMIAEDSSDYPKVTASDGLGFDYKWDLGWMNDTLKYYGTDPIYKKYDHHKLTFSMAYFYNENFLLPLSHDEVVHGKGTIINKMWGNYDQKFSLLRNLYTYQFAHPGKKLNFMGNELASFDEWNENKSLPWNLLDFPKHASVARLIRDLNLIYQSEDAMKFEEYNPEHFKWVMVDNCNDSVYAFERSVNKSKLLFIFNMTPNYYENYDIGCSFKGKYVELFNSDKDVYGGYNQYNGLPLKTTEFGPYGLPHKVTIKLASFGAIILKYKGAR